MLFLSCSLNIYVQVVTFSGSFPLRIHVTIFSLHQICYHSAEKYFENPVLLRNVFTGIAAFNLESDKIFLKVSLRSYFYLSKF